MEHDGGNGNVSSPSPTPTMCTTGCGFYGNSAFDGMCSKCFKDALKRRQQSTSPATHVQAAQQQHETVSGASGQMEGVSVNGKTSDGAVPAGSGSTASFQNMMATSGSAASLYSDTEGATNSDGSSQASDRESEKSRKNRCHICKKKVGLTGFQCRCGGLYCSTHRYSDKHDCQFDYKQQAQDELRKSNPVVTGEKIRKI